MNLGIVTLALAVAAAVVAWRMFGADRHNARIFAATLDWPTAPGLIHSVWVEEKKEITTDADGLPSINRVFEPKVDYTYSVAGRDYGGSRIDFRRMQFIREKRARAVFTCYSAGSAVTIAYDPADPQNSVLDRTSSPPWIRFWTSFWFAIAIVLSIAGLFFLTHDGWVLDVLKPMSE